MLTLSGRTALMIGATGREGMGAVKALADGGMNVVICTVHGLETAQAFLDSDPRYAERCMIALHRDGSKAVMKAAVERFGSLDVIIANHGDHRFTYTPVEQITAADFREELEHMNCTALELIQSALPWLRESRAGRIILMANAGARTGLPEEGLCQSAARAALINMTMFLARELGGDGITVNCIARAGMEGEPNTEQLLKKMPLGRPGTREEFGAAVAYLASEEAGFLTGQVLNFCGGLYMG